MTPAVAVFMIVILCIAALCAIEFMLRQKNPWRLESKAFDEFSVMLPHTDRGWMQRPNYSFDFYHRYLPKPNRIQFNNLGFYDLDDHKKQKPENTIRILLMGDATSAGWELAREETIAARLRVHLSERYPEQEFDVIDASVRLYSTGQFVHLYENDLKEFRPDLMIYFFNLNHPRRTITVHESGKSPALSQPVHSLDQAGKLIRLSAHPAAHKNDMIYLDDNGDICNIPGHTDTSLWKSIRDHLHIADVIDAWWLGNAGVRDYKDRQEIKDIERKKFIPGAPANHEDLPFHWKIISALLHKLVKTVHGHGGRLLVVSNLAYYCVRDGGLHKDTATHPFGFAFDNIPDRRYLPFIARTAGFIYVDTYDCARKCTPAFIDSLSLHPRYAYATAAGADYHASIIADHVGQSISLENEQSRTI